MSEIKPVSTYDTTVSSSCGSADNQPFAIIDESVFSSIDKDNNGIISATEAKEYGFSAWEITSDLSQSDFEAKLKTFNEKAFAKSQTIQTPEEIETAFAHHFSKAGKDGKVIQQLTLSYDEQQLLLKRMNAFEEYKTSLTPKEQTILEKNKNSMLDFAFKSWGRGNEYKSYDEFQKYSAELKSTLEKNIKTGKTTTLTNEELAQIFYATDTTDMISDGKLGSSAQGLSGDCWALSQFNNYAQSKKGAENIAKRIKQNDDGTFTVTFQNPKKMNETKSYIITQDELKNFGIQESDISDQIIAKTRNLPLIGDNIAKALHSVADCLKSNEEKPGDYSAGDIDTRVYEIATSKMLKEFAPENDNSINGGSAIKRVLLHRAMGYKSDIIIYQRYLEEDTKLASEAPRPLENENNMAKEYDPKFFKDTVKNNKNVVFAITHGLDENGHLTTNISIEDNCENLSDVLKKHPEYKAENLTCNTQLHKDTGITSKENRYLQGGHVYNMKSIDRKNGTITLQDPYNSAFPLAITQDRFANRDINDKNAHDFVRMTYLPME